MSTTPTNPHILAVQALMNDGLTQSEAITKHAKDSETPRNTVYGAMRRAGLAGNSTPVAPVDPVDAARKLIETALANVDDDVKRLKDQADAATTRYREARDGAQARKAELKAKIAALTPQPEPVIEPTVTEGAEDKTEDKEVVA